MLNTLLIANISGSTAMLIILGLAALAVVLGSIVRYIEKKDEDREDEILNNTIPVGDGLSSSPKCDFGGPLDEEQSNVKPDVATQPAPSCLALGVAKSILETPEYWVVYDDRSAIYDYALVYLSVRHHVIGTTLVAGAYYTHTGMRSGEYTWVNDIQWVKINDVLLDSIDAKPIIEAIKANPIGQYKQYLDTEAKKKEVAEKTESYFSHLGCPPSEESPTK